MNKLIRIAMAGLLCLMVAGCDDEDHYNAALYTISGQVYSEGQEINIGWPDITVTLDGDQTLTTTTDVDGNYSFIVPSGEYRITPTQSGNTFDPLDNVFTVIDTDINGIDFMVGLFGAVHTGNYWKKTGSLTYSRSDHTITLLQDGTVLVAGGTADYGMQNTRASAEIYDPETGKWLTTGYMTYERSEHTATLLPDGKVLVAGGVSDDSLGHLILGKPRASAELYNPLTKKWTTTGAMTYERTSHTMTLLKDGRVLVVGGLSEKNNARASAELYDPEKGEWSITGSMAEARYKHTMILLPDGKVLVAGGQGLNSASTELYDPKTEKWSSTTGPMTYERYSHTMTLLPDGKVLVAGGQAVGHSENTRTSAELYDPVTGKWSTTGSMADERYGHTATLLNDGRILVAAGRQGDILSAPPKFAFSSELYDPATGKWSSTTVMTSFLEGQTMTLLNNGKVLIAGGAMSGSDAALYKPDSYQSTVGSLYDHTQTLLDDGRVLVAGGVGDDEIERADAELYDPETSQWSTTGSMADARYKHTVTSLADGRLLAAGGINETRTSNARAELYDPLTEKWTTTHSMTYERHLHTATLLANGWVLVAGGESESSLTGFTINARSSAEIYKPETGRWSIATSMNHERSEHTATLLRDGRVLVAGGLSTNDNARASAEIYDPATGKWTTTGAMTYERYGHKATLLDNDKVLVAGGLSTNDNARASAELYDPETGEWTIAGSMTYERYEYTMSLLKNKKVLVVGGLSTNDNARASAEVYDPVTDEWSITGSLAYERYGHTMSLLDEERVLVAGGLSNDGTSPGIAEIYNQVTGLWSTTPAPAAQ